MASVSAAHLVLFIAAILVSAAVAGTMTNSANRIGQAIQDSGAEEAAEREAAIRVVSDAGSPAAVYDNSSNTLTLLVKNTGDGTLPAGPDSVTVLVNGTYQSDVTTNVLEASDWTPGRLLRVEVNVSLPSNEETRVVVKTRGGRDLFVFTTP